MKWAQSTRGVLSIVPLSEDPIKTACGMLKGGRSLTEALLKERAKEQARQG